MKILCFFLLSLHFISADAQKIEHLRIDWPAEYKWKIVYQKDDSVSQITTIIPGHEKVKNASIIGNIVAKKEVVFTDLDKLLNYYRAGMDTGSILTVVDRNDSTGLRWVLFKVETPKTDKYPEPESDLYYVIQGEYGLYENYVAIKKPNLDEDFINKWSKIFRAASLTIE